MDINQSTIRETLRRVETLKSLTSTSQPIVCLCGSAKFKREFDLLNQILTGMSCIVISNETFLKGNPVYDKLGINKEDLKEDLKSLRFEKVKIADFLLIICPEDYIDDSTEEEIKFAETLNKRAIFHQEYLDLEF